MASRRRIAVAVDLLTRLKARKEARFHVQVALEKIQADPSTPGEVRVEGRVTRIFHTDGTLALGDNVSFILHVYQHDEATPPGPVYVSYDRLANATHIEAYLNGTAPRCDIPAGEYTLLFGPREQPSMTVAELENVVTDATLVTPVRTHSRSWRFWKK
jgi:hypothetical protein